MTFIIKLTDKNDRTYGDTQWGPGVTHSGTGEGDLCGPGYIHVYTDALLAVMFNLIHAGFDPLHMWEGEGDIALDDYGVKYGCITATTIRRIEPPVVTLEQRIKFTLLATKAVYTDPAWNRWADNWLSGKDRSAWMTASVATEKTARMAAKAAARGGRLDLAALAREAMK